jgi:hypothetical protein
MKFQLESPLTAAKQGMMVIVTLVIIFVTMAFIPDVIGGENIPKKLLVCGMVMLGYGLIWLARSFFLPKERKMESSSLLALAVLAFMWMPLWLGIFFTNWFFCELENSEANNKVESEVS